MALNRDQKIVLIGAETMIGYRLVQLLLEQGFSQIHLLRHNGPLLEGELLDLKKLTLKVNIHEIDIFDLFELEPIFETADYIINCYGTSAGFKHSRDVLYKHNIIGVRTWIDLALTSDIKGFIHISTAASLGRKKDGSPCKESDSWQKNELHGNYNKSKFLGELEVARGQSEGLNTILIHPTHVLGKGGILQIYLNQLRKNTLKYPIGTGGYIGVKDVAAFTLKVLEAGLWGERFLLNAANLSHKEVIDQIATEWDLAKPTKKISTQDIRVIGWIMLLSKWLGILLKTPSKEWYHSLKANFSYDNTKSVETGLMQFTSIDSCIKEIHQQDLL
jgi:dihydroflavonol-4-reductase